MKTASRTTAKSAKRASKTPAKKKTEKLVDDQLTNMQLEEISGGQLTKPTVQGFWGGDDDRI